MKKKNISNDVTILEDIIFNQNEKIRKLDDQNKSLKEQLELAYSLNAGFQERQNNEEKTRNLTKLNTLLLVIMGLTQKLCDDTDYGRCISNAIKNFYTDTALNLVKHVDYGLGNKKDEAIIDDEEETDDGGENEF